MKLYLHPTPVVYQDIADAYNWYQLQLDGLGDDFINELEAAYSLISQMPQSWPNFGKNPAVFLLHRFPFAAVYFPVNNELFVVAVMHQSCKPDFWRNRKV